MQRPARRSSRRGAPARLTLLSRTLPVATSSGPETSIAGELHGATRLIQAVQRNGTAQIQKSDSAVRPDVADLDAADTLNVDSMRMNSGKSQIADVDLETPK